MAVSTVQTNNKLIKFTQEICNEWIQANQFSAYTGEEITSIIRRRMELKAGGEQVNIPLVARLTGAGVGTGTLVGNEEEIDDFGLRVKVDWARNAVVTTKGEMQKDSADIFGEAKPLLSNWLRELNRDETVAALMALPSETLPATDIRVNGIQYDLATAAERNTWNANNSDRVLYGAAVSNYNATHATALLNVDTTADKLTATNLSLMKRVAMNANPHIRPYTTDDGYEYFVAFCGTNAFRDLKIDLQTVNKDSRPREGADLHVGPAKNPLYQDGDQLYDGVIARCIPQISQFVGTTANPGPWGSALLTAGASSARIEPVFLCGQQAVAWAIAQMPKPTFRDETDYQFRKGVGIETCYGIAKMFKKHPKSSSVLKQWGVVTGFFASASD